MYSMYSVFHAVAHGCLGVQLQVRQYSIIKGYLLDFGFFSFYGKKCSQRRVSVWMDVNATVGLTGCQRYDRLCGIAGVAAGPDKKRLLLTHLLGYRMYVLYRIGACRVIESMCFTVLKPTRL